MNINTENAIEILNKLVDMSPDFEHIIRQFNDRIETVKARKAELLQADKNLAEDEVAVEREIAGCRNAITGCKKQINELTGRMLQYSKQLKLICSRREAVHKEWILNFGNNK